MSHRKNIVILGASGSIGRSTLAVVRQYPDRFRIVGLSVNRNTEALAGLEKEFRPQAVAVRDPARAATFRRTRGRRVRVLSGREGLCALAALRSADTVIVAIAGAEAIFPLLEAVRARKTIGLANKESIVMAGEIVRAQLDKARTRLIPIDSEQSAIFQCLENRDSSTVEHVYLTASGGPLVDYKKSALKDVPLSRVLAHPRWRMGRKITVDSATLMNKGLEVIETQRLFDIALDKIRVMVHRQSLVHSMVAFRDGSVLAQVGVTDMRLPIQYALTYPERWKNPDMRWDPLRAAPLTFEAPDMVRFPCLALAYEAARRGGGFPCALNAANEEAVRAYLEGRLEFGAIADVVERVLGTSRIPTGRVSLREIFATDAASREAARHWVIVYGKKG